MAHRRSGSSDHHHDSAEHGRSDGDGRRSRWTDHRAQRRAAFVAAGVAAIDVHGPEASAEQIAGEAGVSRTVLYRYFRDREDLRQAIAEQVVQVVVGSVVPSLRIGPRSTPREIITTAVGVIVGWLDEHPNLYLFLRSRRSGSSLDSVENTLASNIAELLKLLLTVFGLDSSQADPGAYGIVGYVEAAGGWWLSSDRSMSPARFTDLVSVGIWHMLEGVARDYGVDVGYDEPLPWDPSVLAGLATAEEPV